jgi:hypothetical protein
VQEELILQRIAQRSLVSLLGKKIYEPLAPYHANNCDDSPRLSPGAFRSSPLECTQGDSFAKAPSEPDVRFNLTEQVREKALEKATRVKDWHTGPLVRSYIFTWERFPVKPTNTIKLRCQCAMNRSILTFFAKGSKSGAETQPLPQTRNAPSIPEAEGFTARFDNHCSVPVLELTVKLSTGGHKLNPSRSFGQKAICHSPLGSYLRPAVLFRLLKVSSMKHGSMICEKPLDYAMLQTGRSKNLSMEEEIQDEQHI